jgi:hypothetical protein
MAAEHGFMSRADFSSNGIDEALFAGVSENGATHGSEPLPCIDVLDLDRTPLPVPAFVVDYLFPEGAVVLLSGDSGSCKTALMLHASFANAFEDLVGGRFATMPAAGPVLYFNGELDPALLQMTIRQAAAGFGKSVSDVPRGSFIFGGDCGMTSLRFRSDFSDTTTQRRAFETMIDEKRPALVILDTQRAMFDMDEKEAVQVRAEFVWLKRLATDYRCCIVVLHHLRKIGAMNNGERERVSGSRDLIGAVDVHLSAKSDNGRPMRALRRQDALPQRRRYQRHGVPGAGDFRGAVVGRPHRPLDVHDRGPDHRRCDPRIRDEHRTGYARSIRPRAADDARRSRRRPGRFRDAEARVHRARSSPADRQERPAARPERPLEARRRARR